VPIEHIVLFVNFTSVLWKAVSVFVGCGELVVFFEAMLGTEKGTFLRGTFGPGKQINHEFKITILFSSR
jgi:hypothetical protein